MADYETPTKMLHLFLLATLLPFSNSEYIPPGPTYPCPKETTLLYPCVCENGTDAGLFISCQNSNLAAMSVGIGNLAGMGLPVEKLTIKECSFSHLFGPLFHRSIIRVIHIIDTPIQTIDEYTFAGVNRTLQELYFFNTEIEEFPKEAFKILSNLTKLSIDGHKMTKISKDIFAGSEAAGRLERLHLVNGQIEDIPIEAFQNLRKLKTLDLHGNKLATLKRNQFKGLREVELLDISHNKITKLDGSHMGDLTRMGWCNASHNQIADIPRAMFARNTLLKVLHLDNNKLKKLDTNSFKGMRFLRRLYLQDNQITEIGRGTFSSVTRIGTIDLARNKLTKVDYQMFQAAKFAEMINLAENQIKLIDAQAFTDLYLATVNISYNQLDKIEAGAFQNCQNMTVLDLRFNNLTDINKKAFDENTYAFELNVAFNGFTDFGQIPIQNMSGIRIVNASYNEITVIPKGAFPKLYELHTVDISHNKLVDIFNAVFQNLFSLRYLDLSYNTLQTIKPATFGSIPTLLSLDLSNNELTSVSRGSMAKLSSCRELNFENNMLETLFHIPGSLSSLNIANNSIQEIKPNTWPQMNALLSLNLSSNKLSDLSGDAFTNLLSVQRLDLSDNMFDKPPPNLNTMTSLQYLYLKNNNITELQKSAFGTLPTLFELDLSSNNLHSIEKQAFLGLQQLQNLTLSQNELRHIPNEVFKGLVALRRLDLSQNYLEKIDNKTNGLLDDLLSLNMVNLSYNNIGFITKKMFPSNPWIPYRLREIDLSHNKIPVLTYDITIGAKTVQRLYLRGNYVNEIRNNVLGNLTSLEVIDLSNNKLQDLISKTSETKFHLPTNITHIYLQNNSLSNLPLTEVLNAQKLAVLDVSHNDLTVFDRALVKKIRDERLEVYFEGNPLKCDCLVRPLKHYINHLPNSILKTDKKYQNIICNEPLNLNNENLINLDEDRLICSGNIDGRNDTFGRNGRNDEFDFVNEPDVAFRDIQYAQSSIYVHWYVLTTQDVADFVIYIKDNKHNILTSHNVAYNLRSLTITIDNKLKTSLQSPDKFDICLQAKTSNDSPRKWHPSQCQTLAGNFDSWPRKLTVDRRLSKRKFVSMSNSVLTLVSDSILITLCIFLGVWVKMTDFSSI